MTSTPIENPFEGGTDVAHGWDVGVIDARKAMRAEDRGHAVQALLEQFILFTQDAGYSSAVMTLDQMQSLRTEVNELKSQVSDAKDQAELLSDKLAAIEVY